MTLEMYDMIRGLIEDGINQVSINDDDIEFGIDIDYDRKISIHDVNLNDTYAFTSANFEEIDNHYKIVDKSE